MKKRFFVILFFMTFCCFQVIAFQFITKSANQHNSIDTTESIQPPTDSISKLSAQCKNHRIPDLVIKIKNRFPCFLAYPFELLDEANKLILPPSTGNPFIDLIGILIWIILLPILLIASLMFVLFAVLLIIIYLILLSAIFMLMATGIIILAGAAAIWWAWVAGSIISLMLGGLLYVLIVRLC